jgi:hypothetical protein
MTWKLQKAFNKTLNNSLNKYYGIVSTFVFRGVSTSFKVLTEVDMFDEKIDQNGVVTEEQYRKVEVLCSNQAGVYEILKPLLLAGEKNRTNSLGALAKQKNEYAFLYVPNADGISLIKYRIFSAKETDTSTRKVLLLCTLVEKAPIDRTE